MKRNSLLLFALIVFIGLKINYAQAPDWTRVLQFNTNGPHAVNGVTTDANSVYAAISISSNITFEGTNFTSVGLKDLLLVKTDYAGTVAWMKHLNAQAYGTVYANAIRTDASGNIYISGILSGTTTIGSSTITSDAPINAFIAKFDTDGNGLWATKFSADGTGSSRLTLDASGDIYLISRSSKLMKFSSTGAKVWEQTYPDKTLQAIAIHGSSLYIGGCLQNGTTTFGAIPLASLGSINTGFLLKADLDGVYTNSLLIDGSTAPGKDGSTITDIICDNSGNLIITGAYVKDLILGTVTITNTESAHYTYVAKCDNNLVFTWAKSSTSLNYTSATILLYRLFLDNSGNIFQYGMNSYSIAYESVSLSPGSNQFLFKFDSNGNPISGQILSNSNVGLVAVFSDGKIFQGKHFNTDGPSYGNFALTQLNNDLTVNWEKVSSNSLVGTASIKYIKHDAEGNMYLLTRILGRCDYFGTPISTNITLTVISKHDINGTLLWKNQIADNYLNWHGTGFLLDKDNSIITSGFFKTSLTVGSTTLTTSNTSYEGYVAKYNTAGDFLWAAKMDLGGNVNSSITVATDKDKNVIVSGVKRPSNYIVKFNAEGSRLWSKEFPMESEFFAMTSTDDDKNIYLTSEIYLNNNGGSTTIGTVTLNQTNEDGATALIKLDPDGNAIWAKTYGGIDGATWPTGWAVNIRTDAVGNSYLWGWCENNAKFGANTFTNPFTPNEKFSFYITKINTSGDVVWAKAIYEAKMGFNYGDLLDLGKDGNIYVGGHFKDMISLDGTIYTPEGLNDFFAIKFSINGIFQWMKTIPSDAGSIINGLSVYDNDVLSLAGHAGKSYTLGGTTINKKNGSNCIVATLGNLKYIRVSSNTLNIAAAANSTNSFSVSSNIDWNVYSNQTWLTVNSPSGSNNATITVTAASNPTATTRTANITISGADVTDKTVVVTQASGTSGVNDIDGLKEINIFPNPCNGRFKISLNNYRNETIDVTISDALGRTVKSLTLNGLPENHAEEISIENIANGLYFVIVKTNNSKVVKTITITN